MAEFFAFLSGIVAFGYGVNLLVKNFNLMNNGVSTIGVVTKLRPSRKHWGMQHPTISFKPRKGRQVEFEYKFSSTFGPVFHLHQPVAVRYDPNDPREATIDSIPLMWGPSILLCLLGIGFPALVLFGRK